MNLKVYLFCIVVCVMMLSSCGIERRHYRDGYYCDWFQRDNRNEAPFNDTLTNQLASGDTTQQKTDVQNQVNTHGCIAADSMRVVDAGGISDTNKTQSVTELRKKDPPAREEVFKCMRISMWAVGLGVAGLGLTVGAAYAFSLALFILGFLLVAFSEFAALYVLYRIYRITDAHPDLRWPKTLRRNFDSPYATGKNEDAELLKRMQKARLWAIILSCLVLLCSGTLFGIVLMG